MFFVMAISLVLDIQREEEKVKRSIKDAAKKGQKDVCVILAKEMIHSKRAVAKLYASKAQMNSVLLSMKNQLGECGSATLVNRHWEKKRIPPTSSSVITWYLVLFK